MVIKPISSGSSGNCYVVSDGTTSILIECGISYRDIKEALWNMDMRLAEISACLVSHAHKDHSKAAWKLMRSGLPVYMSREAAEAMNLSAEHALRPMVMGNCYIIGSMKVYGLPMEHDSPGTLGFIVEGHGDRLLYVTDTKYLKWKVSGVTHLMIEANWSESAMAENVVKGEIHESRAKRVINSHMSIDAVLLALERMDMSRLRQVWLIHLSNDNSEEDFKRKVQEICGCEVYVA